MSIQTCLGRLFGLCLCALAFPTANAAIIAQYPFSSSSLASTDTDPNSTASNFVVSPSFSSAAISSRGNPANSIFVTTSQFTATNEAAAVTSGRYLEFSLSNFGTASLTDLTFQVAAEDPAPITYFFRTNAGGDNFTTNLDTFAITPSTGNGTASGHYTNYTATFSDDSLLQNVLGPGPLTIRLYGYSTSGAAATGAGAHRIDNIVLNGTTTPIPEPSLAILALAGIVPAIYLRRRRDNSS
jgi:hypothetical protein